MKKIIFTLLFVCASAQAALTDMKFGQMQIADSQWNVSACLYTATCQIYSKNVGTAFKIPWWNGRLSWATGDYVRFSLSGNSSFPYEAKQYTSSGTVKAVMGTGKIVNMGPDYFFFVGNDNNTGQLFSGSSGMSNSNGVTWTGTLNPSTAQADAYANANYSTVPLASGQVATPSSPPPPPAPTYTSQITAQQQARYNAAVSRLNAIQSSAVYITQSSGGSNNINISQIGRYEHIGGVGQTHAPIEGSGNSITIKQGNPLNQIGKNLIEMSVVGSYNTLSLSQGYQVNGGYIGDSSSHIQLIQINGNSNTLTTSQVGSGQFGEINITGSGNNMLLKQSGTSHKSFTAITGGGNSASVDQSGSGSHYFDLSLSGNGHTAIVNQGGATQNRATVSLINQGGSAGVNLTQTGGQVYNITITCVTSGGCGTTTVTQGN